MPPTIQEMGETLARSRVDLRDRYDCALRLWEYHGVVLFGDEKADELRQVRTAAYEIRQRRGVTPASWFLALPLVAVGVAIIVSCVRIAYADGIPNPPLGPREGLMLLALLAVFAVGVAICGMRDDG